MSSQEIKQYAVDILLTITGTTTGVVSILDSIEQGMRIVLVLVSIVSGIFLIAVNWEKATNQFKKWKK